MTRTVSRRLAVVAAAASAVAVAAPALADTSTPFPVGVSIAGTTPTRTFAVKDMAGVDLHSINLGQGGTMPFQTLVNDADVTGSYGGFDVQATMSNLYLNTTAGHDFNKKIASSDASLLFPLSPLSAAGVTYSVVPKIDVTTGVTCNSASVQGILGIVPGLGGVLPALPAATQGICDALAGAGTTTTTVDGLAAATTLSPAQLDALLGLPLQLASAAGGSSAPFTDADYGDATVGKDDPAKTGKPGATAVSIMSGGQPAASFLAGLSGVVTSLAGKPLASASGAGAQTSVQNVIDGLSARGVPTGLQTLGSQLNAMTDVAKKSQLVNLLTSAVKPLGIGDVVGIGGQYRATPVLRAVPSTVPASGQYDGTLTITFIQH